MRAFSDLTIIIASGSTVSSPVPIRDADSIALQVPTITSGALLLEAAYDTTSASFVAVHAVNSGAAFSYPAAAGLMGLNITPHVAGFPYLRLKTQNSQGADRSFRLYVRR